MKQYQLPLRIGVIGCGSLSTAFHLPGIARIPELKLAALCDIDEGRLQNTSECFRVAETFTDYRRMLDTVSLDGVLIIGPPPLHVEGAKECLKRQIPFMTEKPLTTRVEEAQELAQMAKQYGDCGQVAFTSRFAPAQRLAWRISRSPEFGPVSFVSTCHNTWCHMHPMWDKEDWKEGFINLHGVHGIDLWRFFGGDPVEVAASVACWKLMPDQKSARGSILAYVKTAGGPHGIIQMLAGGSHNGDINSDVMGDGTRVRVENDMTLSYEGDRNWIRTVMGEDVLADTITAEQPVSREIGTGLTHPCYYPDFFRFEWLAFARSLLRGVPLSPSFTDACRTVMLTDAICRSLREDGAIVKVQYETT